MHSQIIIGLTCRFTHVGLGISRNQSRNEETAIMNNQNITADKNKNSILFCIKDDVAATADETVLAGEQFERKGMFCLKNNAHCVSRVKF